MRHYGIGAQQQEQINLYPDVASFVTNFDAALASAVPAARALNLNVEQGGMILDLLQKLPCMQNKPCDVRPYIDTLAVRIQNAWPATESGFVMIGGRRVPAWAKLVRVRRPGRRDRHDPGTAGKRPQDGLDVRHLGPDCGDRDGGQSEPAQSDSGQSRL
jgi:hypothetical protein